MSANVSPLRTRRDDVGSIPALSELVAFDAAAARQLVAAQHSVGHFVVISSSSVYRDALRRALDEASQTGFPELPDPIPETHPTVDSGPSRYSTRKIALERLGHVRPRCRHLQSLPVHRRDA